jgi:uncharacterized protein
MSHVLRRALPALAALGFSVGAHAQTYGVATMQPGTLSYATGSAIAKVMQQIAGMQTRVQPSAGESTLLPLVNNGEVDLGIANISEVVEAYDGRARAGKQDNLRMVAAIHPLRTAFFVRKDSGIKTVADLKGRRVVLGFSAMGTINTIVLAILANGGLSQGDIKPVLVPNVIRGAEEFASGSAENFFFALGGAKVNEMDASVGGVRALNLSDSPQALEATRKVFPYFYPTEVKPRPGLTGVLEPIQVFSYDNMLVAGTHVKDEVVYKILDTLANNKPELAATAPQLNDFNPANLYKKYPVPYHPGAVKWFADHKIEMKQ